jgi:hypothetical protein
MDSLSQSRIGKGVYKLYEGFGGLVMAQAIDDLIYFSTVNLSEFYRNTSIVPCWLLLLYEFVSLS